MIRIIVSDHIGLLKILTGVNLVFRLNTHSSVNRYTFKIQ